KSKNEFIVSVEKSGAVPNPTHTILVQQLPPSALSRLADHSPLAIKPCRRKPEIRTKQKQKQKQPASHTDVPRDLPLKISSRVQRPYPKSHPKATCPSVRPSHAMPNRNRNPRQAKQRKPGPSRSQEAFRWCQDRVSPPS